MTKRLLRLVLAASTLAALPLPAQLVPLRPTAGELTCFPEHPGAWKSEGQNNDARSFGLTVAQGQALLTNVHAFTTLLRAAAVLNPPLGVNPVIWEDMCCPDECRRTHSCTTWPAFGRIWLRLHYFVGQRNGVPYTDSESYADLEILFNNPHRSVSNPVLTFADGRRAMPAPVLWREVGGVTLYTVQSAGAAWAYLTRSGKSLWIPVTREQFLTETIREREAEYLKVEPGDNSALAREGRAISERMLIEPLRAELAKLTPAERAMQAWYSGRNPMAPLEPANAEGAYPLVIFNPEYFDLTRPRTDIQLAVVRLDTPWDHTPEEVVAGLTQGRITNASDLGTARMWQLVNQLDWQKLASLVK